MFRECVECGRVFEEAKMKDIIKRVATGTTTVEDARELERVLEKVYGIWYNLTVHERS